MRSCRSEVYCKLLEMFAKFEVRGGFVLFVWTLGNAAGSQLIHDTIRTIWIKFKTWAPRFDISMIREHIGLEHSSVTALAKKVHCAPSLEEDGTSAVEPLRGLGLTIASL